MGTLRQRVLLSADHRQHPRYSGSDVCRQTMQATLAPTYACLPASCLRRYISFLAEPARAGRFVSPQLPCKAMWNDPPKGCVRVGTGYDLDQGPRRRGPTRPGISRPGAGPGLERHVFHRHRGKVLEAE